MVYLYDACDQISDFWEKCDEKYLGRTEGQTDRGKTVYPPPPSVDWRGGKPTKYCYGLESTNFTSKIIPKIERDNGKTITKQFDILKETKVFYDLYKFREGNGCKVSDLERDLKDLNFNKLSLDEHLSLEGEIIVNEPSKVLQKMNNKSPGSDGFSTEFFKFFWIDLKSFVVNSINFGSLLGELSVT